MLPLSFAHRRVCLVFSAVVALESAPSAFADSQTGSHRKCPSATADFSPMPEEEIQIFALDEQPTIITKKPVEPKPFSALSPSSWRSPVDSPIDVLSPQRNTDDVPTQVGGKAPPVSVPPAFETWMTDKGYAFQQILGHGGEGIVVEARKGGATGKRVALKYTDPVKGNGVSSAASRGSAQARLKSEAALLRKLNRAEAGKKKKFFLESELSGDGLVIEMEFFAKNPDPKNPGHKIKAPTLRDRLASGKMSPSLRRKVMHHLLEAVARMHAEGIVHRDLKPANILVDDNGNIKVIDLGLAALRDDYPPGVDPENLSGTLDFMGPEQLGGRPAMDKNDVDALRKTFMALFLGLDAPQSFHRAIGSIKARDYKYAPEDVLEGRMALAVWSFHPKTIAEYSEVIHLAETLTKKEFYLWYGKQLLKISHDDMAAQIVQSQEAIAQFPQGFGFSEADAAAIARAVEKLEAETAELRLKPDRKPYLTGPPPFAHYGAFRDRLQALQRR